MFEAFSIDSFTNLAKPQSPFLPPKYPPQNPLKIPTPLIDVFDSLYFDFEKATFQRADEDRTEIRDDVVRKYAKNLSHLFITTISDALSIAESFEELKDEKTTLHSSVEVKYPKMYVNKREFDFINDYANKSDSNIEFTTLSTTTDYHITRTSAFATEADPNDSTLEYNLDTTTTDGLFTSTTDPAQTTTEFLLMPADTYPIKDFKPNSPYASLRSPTNRDGQKYDSLRQNIVLPKPQNNNNIIFPPEFKSNEDAFRTNSSLDLFTNTNTKTNDTASSLPFLDRDQSFKGFHFIPSLPQFEPPDPKPGVIDSISDILKTSPITPPISSDIEPVRSLPHGTSPLVLNIEPATSLQFNQDISPLNSGTLKLPQFQAPNNNDDFGTNIMNLQPKYKSGTIMKPFPIKINEPAIEPPIGMNNEDLSPVNSGVFISPVSSSLSSNVSNDIPNVNLPEAALENDNSSNTPPYLNNIPSPLNSITPPMNLKFESTSPVALNPNLSPINSRVYSNPPLQRSESELSISSSDQSLSDSLKEIKPPTGVLPAVIPPFMRGSNDTFQLPPRIKSISPPNSLTQMDVSAINVAEVVKVKARTRAATIINVPPLPEVLELPKIDLNRPGINLKPVVTINEYEGYDSLRGVK